MLLLFLILLCIQKTCNLRSFTDFIFQILQLSQNILKTIFLVLPHISLMIMYRVSQLILSSVNVTFSAHLTIFSELQKNFFIFIFEKKLRSRKPLTF
jgi:hypothetical protein